MSEFLAPTEEEFAVSKAWGIITSIDIYDCDAEIIKDGKAIEKFTHELCKRIDVKRYKDTIIEHFGDDPKVHGYSMVQLIESSLVSGHFAEESNGVYLDVFSCKYYNAQEAVKFAQDFFKGKTSNAHCILRGCSDNLPANFIHSIQGRNIILQAVSTKNV